MQSDRDTELALQMSEAIAGFNRAMESARSEGLKVEFRFDGIWRDFEKIPLRYVRVVKAEKTLSLASAA